MKREIYRAVRDGRKLNTQLAEHDSWRVQFAQPWSYEGTFAYLLPEDGFEGLMQHWPDARQIAGLDVMGSGHIFYELGFGHGAGMALSDARPDDMKNKHGASVDVITGDVLDPASWRAVTEWLRAQDMPDKAFQLILFRPLGGITTIPQHPDLLYTLLQRAWNVLSDQNGELFSVIPYACSNLVHQWVDVCNQIPGVRARMQRFADFRKEYESTLPIGNAYSMPSEAIRFTKTTGAPRQLPQVAYKRYSVNHEYRYDPDE